jgi:hypothetical protein
LGFRVIILPFCLIKKVEKLKAERYFCPQAFTPTRRSAGPSILFNSPPVLGGVSRSDGVVQAKYPTIFYFFYLFA